MKTGILWIVAFFVIGSLLSVRFYMATKEIVDVILGPVKGFFGITPVFVPDSGTLPNPMVAVGVTVDDRGPVITIDAGTSFQ